MKLKSQNATIKSAKSTKPSTTEYSGIKLSSKKIHQSYTNTTNFKKTRKPVGLIIALIIVSIIATVGPIISYIIGRSNGQEDGTLSGYETGYNVGYNDGWSEGNTSGYGSGYQDGYYDGDQHGYRRACCAIYGGVFCTNL